MIISLNFLPVLKKSENELIENADEEININNINCNYILEFFGDMNNYKGDIDENNMKNLLKKIYLKLLLLKIIKFLYNENNYKWLFFTLILILK